MVIFKIQAVSHVKRLYGVYSRQANTIGGMPVLLWPVKVEWDQMWVDTENSHLK